MRMLEMHIEVDDLDRSLDFYRRLIPHEKIVRWPDNSAAALVMADGNAFGIWKQGKRGIHNGQGAQHLHYAFLIEMSEWDDYKRKLEALDVEILYHDWKRGHKSMYFFDPDGHQGEFMTCDWLELGKD